MKSDFDYNSVPYSFIHCFNSKCLQADNCLRYQVGLRVTSQRGVLTVVNPVRETSIDEKCPYFKSDTLQMFALGMIHLLDSVPHHDALIIRQQMLRHFGKTYFYRLWRKERFFSPDQQEYVRSLFLKRGISNPPVFDEYVEQYDWKT